MGGGGGWEGRDVEVGMVFFFLCFYHYLFISSLSLVIFSPFFLSFFLFSMKVFRPSVLSCFLSSLLFTTSLAQWLRRPPRERKVPGSIPACAGIFSGSSHTGDLNIGTPVATLPGAWRYRVSTGTGRPGVSILGEVESLICNVCSATVCHV